MNVSKYTKGQILPGLLLAGVLTYSALGSNSDKATINDIPGLVQECRYEIDTRRYSPEVKEPVLQITDAALAMYGDKIGINAIADVNPNLVGEILEARNNLEGIGHTWEEIAYNYEGSDKFSLDAEVPGFCLSRLEGLLYHQMNKK